MAKESIKAYNATNRRSPQLRAAINNTLIRHKHHDKAYFWRPAKTKTERLFRQFQFSIENPAYSIHMGKDNIEVFPWYTESPSQVTYRLFIKVNGERKDVRVLKSILQNRCIK